MNNQMKKAKLLLILGQFTILTAQAKCIIKKIKEKKKRNRNCHVRRINRTRNIDGFYVATFQKMKLHDHEQFFICTRMTVHMFNNLLNIMEPKLETSARLKSHHIKAECRLSVTLLYLSLGVPIQKLAWSFKLGKETVRSIILDTTEVLWTTLFPIYAREPEIHDYEETESDFWNMWNFPNCIGAIDGKHIAIKCPPRSGSQYFNYKKFFSIVLLGVCDAKYRFTHIDIGAYGSQSDGGVFQNSMFGKKIINKTLMIPPAKQLPNTEVMLPHYIVADAAFPLNMNIMRPYAGRNLSAEKEYFNKRLSRARRTIENAFGILVARWRILQQTLHMNPSNAEKIVLACVVLHNYIMYNNDNEGSQYISDIYVDWEDSAGVEHEGLWHAEVGQMLPQINPSNGRTHYGGSTAIEIRNNLKDFICSNSLN